MARLKYLSNSSLEALRASITDNLERYQSGSFAEIAENGEWEIELNVDVELAPLATLDAAKGPISEISNSKKVWTALGAMTPALAYEESIWVRLTHVECLDFSRNRWLQGATTAEEVEKMVRLHFFAATLSARRDDNAISRLWWNAYIANQISPDDFSVSLNILLKSADIRSNVVERSLTGSRTPLATGIVRAIDKFVWVTAIEGNFRSFMRVLNRFGGGVVFEALSSEEIDAFILKCLVHAGMPQLE